MVWLEGRQLQMGDHLMHNPIFRVQMITETFRQHNLIIFSSTKINNNNLSSRGSHQAFTKMIHLKLALLILVKTL